MAEFELLDEQLAAALSEYADLARARVHPAPAEFASRFPAVEQELTELLGTMLRTLEGLQQFEARLAGVGAPRRTQLPDAAALGHEVRIDRRPDCVPLLLLFAEKIAGVTRLAKLLFLAGKETSLAKIVPDFYRFVPDNFGPFDEAIYPDLSALETSGLVTTQRVSKRSTAADADVSEVQRGGVLRSYQLTGAGREFAQKLIAWADRVHPGLRGELHALVSRHAQLSLRDLLVFVYRNYPESTLNSRIRRQVLGEK